MAQQMKVTAPSQPSAEQKETYNSLSKEHGARFDKKFTQDMVQGHKLTIFMYKREAKKNGPVAQFAQQTIPTLQKHLQTAQAIENKGAMTGSKSGTK
jgi:putative membrane protein